MYIKLKGEKKRRKELIMKEKQTIYFKEDTQELIITPIVEKNCYYVGELKPKVIKRIREFLKNKTLTFIELEILLKNNPKFRYKALTEIIAEYDSNKDVIRYIIRIEDIE